MLNILAVTLIPIDSYALRPIATQASYSQIRQNPDDPASQQAGMPSSFKRAVIIVLSAALIGAIVYNVIKPEIPVLIPMIETSPTSGTETPTPAPIPVQEDKTAQLIADFIEFNSSTVDGDTLSYSFYIPSSERQDVFNQITASHGDPLSASQERRAVDSMINFYDASSAQILLVYQASDDWFLENSSNLAHVLEKGYWGQMKLWSDDINYFPMGDEISLVFRSTDGNGKLEAYDPMERTINSWDDWKPVSGENAWIALSLAHTHKRKQDLSGGTLMTTTDLEQAERIANSLILMQADNGGIRYAPKGTYYSDTDMERIFCWNEVSTENSLSAHAAFRALYQITGNQKYLNAMSEIERYLESVAVYDKNTGDYYFAQGAHYYQTGHDEGEWRLNMEYFATDSQTWAIASLGADKVNEIFYNRFGNEDQSLGDTAASKIWSTTLRKAGQYSLDEQLIGLSYTANQDVISIEWTAGGIQAALILADYYKGTPMEQELFEAAVSMRKSLESFRVLIVAGKEDELIAYPYSSGRTYIPFNWWAPPPNVLSTASSAWIGFLNTGIDPFRLQGKIPMAEKLFFIVAAENIPLLAMYYETLTAQEEIMMTDVEVIAAQPSGMWSEDRAFSCYIDGDFDLTKYDTLRIAFDSTLAGTHFYVRLLPKGQSYNSKKGLSNEKYTIPENGIIDIPVAESQLGLEELASIIQISVHSGMEAWGRDLGQSKTDQAIFKRIEAFAKLSSAGVLSYSNIHRHDFAIQGLPGAVTVSLKVKYEKETNSLITQAA